MRAAADARQICAGEINSRSLVERALVRLGGGRRQGDGVIRRDPDDEVVQFVDRQGDSALAP